MKFDHSAQTDTACFIGASLGLSDPWVYSLHLYILIALLTVQLWPSCLVQDFFITLFVVLLLKELLGIIQALA